MLARLLAILILALPVAPAMALEPLRVERVELGDSGPELQAYNLQETATLRVFARSLAGFKRSQIFWQRRAADGGWRAPEPMPFADPRWRDSDPHIAADGRTLSFVSDRPAEGDQPRGQLDLFEARLLDAEAGQWSAPRRLPEALQSPGYELGPERHGEQLYFGSYRAGGPGRLAVYRADGDGAAPQALPAPVNEGEANSDFTLSPDGRYALWWSSRAGAEGGGDLYLAERVGEQFGPALRLPAPINGPGFEFTPSLTADGRWLLFASTRAAADSAPGLAHMYRVSRPALLEALGPQAQAFSRARLEASVAALWHAFGHAAGQAADAGRLAALLHPQARIWGQQPNAGASRLDLRSWSAEAFLAALREPGARALHECEIHRELRRYTGQAEVYSVVESRRDPARAEADYVGVNSMQWQLGAQGWQLLSLHYALELPGEALPAHAGRSGQCLG
jgi:hypothetical protein